MVLREREREEGRRGRGDHGMKEAWSNAMQQSRGAHFLSCGTTNTAEPDPGLIGVDAL